MGWWMIDLSATPKQRVQSMVNAMTNEEDDWNGFDTNLLKGLEVEEAGPGKLSCTLVTEESLCNKLGVLHGGAAATILDCVTSFTLLTIARKGYWETTGVSRALNLTYHRPIDIGTKFRIEGEVVSVGRQLAHLRGRIIRVDNGEVCVTCTQDKSYIRAKI